MSNADTAHEPHAGRASRWTRQPWSVAVLPVSPTLTQVPIATARYVLLGLAGLLTGYSIKAMERKIERGDWQEGKVWIRAPDGRIHIDMVGYHKWVEGR